MFSFAAASAISACLLTRSILFWRASSLFLMLVYKDMILSYLFFYSWSIFCIRLSSLYLDCNFCSLAIVCLLDSSLYICYLDLRLSVRSFKFNWRAIKSFFMRLSMCRYWSWYICSNSWVSFTSSFSFWANFVSSSAPPVSFSTYFSSSVIFCTPF